MGVLLAMLHPRIAGDPPPFRLHLVIHKKRVAFSTRQRVTLIKPRKMVLIFGDIIPGSCRSASRGWGEGVLLRSIAK